MGFIYCIIGASATGKDTVCKALLKDEGLGLRHIVPYTSRDARSDEADGEEYHFCTMERLHELVASPATSIIDTTNIEWHDQDGQRIGWQYLFLDDGQISVDYDYVVIAGSIATYLNFCKYFGRFRAIPIYLELEGGLRLQRAIDREKKEIRPQYAEVCRRFLADEREYSERAVEKADIPPYLRFDNVDLPRTLDAVKGMIRTYNR